MLLADGPQSDATRPAIISALFSFPFFWLEIQFLRVFIFYFLLKWILLFAL